MERRSLAFCLLLLALGCNRKPDSAAETPENTDVLVPPPAADKYREPFAKAVSTEVGIDQEPPVERTISGKSTAKLRDEVEKIWQTIEIADANDKPLSWIVVLETDAGVIEIALRPEWAPNHVRNFIALAKVGYFDGLNFDRIVDQQVVSPDGVRSAIHLVRFGCPAGTGDPGIGHIGYRLRSEFSDEKHAIGTVAFARDRDPNSAGSRLYITLAPAPELDGNYTIVGRVITGLHVVEKIAAGKTVPGQPEVPVKPTVIQKATAKTLP